MAAIGKAQVALGIFLVWSVTNGAASAESALEMRGYCKAIAQEAQTAANNTILVPTTFEAGVCWGGFSAIQGYAVMAYTGECVFRGDAPTDSDLMRPPVPISSAHRFRGIRPPL